MSSFAHLVIVKFPYLTGETCVKAGTSKGEHNSGKLTWYIFLLVTHSTRHSDIVPLRVTTFTEMYFADL